MTRQSEPAEPGQTPDKHQPHVFEEVDLLPMSQPFTTQGVGPYTPPPTAGSKAIVCGICKKPRADRIHIEGEAEADAESPHWGL